MSIRLYSNSYSSALYAAITNSATTLIVASAAGLPTITGSDYYYLTLDGGAAKEIIKVTAAVGTTLTIVRAQEGTTALSWILGSPIELRATASSFAAVGGGLALDANSNLTANSYIVGFTTTATAAGTTTLLVTSAQRQVFTGATTQTITLPVTSTLAVGQSFRIVNQSTGSLTVNSSGANLVKTVTTLTYVDVVCVLISGTTSASWEVESAGAGGGGGAGDVVGPASATSSGVALFDGTTGKLIKNSAGVDALINTMTVGLGLGQVVTDTVVGVSAGSAITTSADDTFVGYEAGKLVTNGNKSTMIGSQAGAQSTSSTNDNVYVGYRAGYNYTSLAENNTCIGSLSGYALGSKSNQVCVGYSAGRGAGTQDTVVGSQAVVTGGGSYDAFGYLALTANTGYQNCAFGNSSLTTAGGAADNAYFGYLSGTAVTSGGLGCGFGSEVMKALTTGVGNCAFGYRAGWTGATGAVALTTGGYNTMLGIRAGVSALDAVGTIAIGADSVGTKETGTTSGTFGPGLSIGSAAYKVGWRGDGTIIPSTVATNQAGYLRIKLNGTQYRIALITDATEPLVSLTAGITGTLAVLKGGTGVTTSTGSGANALATSPTLVTPILGTPTSGALTNCTSIPVANATGVLPVVNGGTGIASNLYFRAERITSVQSVVTATWTKVQLNGEIADTNNAYDPTTNYRFTVPSGFDGLYEFDFSISIATLTDAKAFGAAIYKNGVEASRGLLLNIGATGYQYASGHAMLPLVATDYIELYVYHDNGSNRDVYGAGASNIFTYMAGRRASA